MHLRSISSLSDFFLPQSLRDSLLLLSIPIGHFFYCNKINTTLRGGIRHMNITVTFIHAPIDGHSGCFQFGAILNKAAMIMLIDPASV